MLCHQFWQCFLIKGRLREKLRIVGDTTPTVDVFVTCCKESVEVIVDTVRAAAAIDWPSSSFRVVVLDDGGDLELKTAVDAISQLYPNVYYTARTKVKGVPHHFKAGNLNHGLQFVSDLPGGASAYIAALDADMIPEPEWLRAIIAHLVIEPKLALSCPPQVRRPSIQALSPLTIYSCSTTYLKTTRSCKAWILSCISLSLSRMLQAWRLVTHFELKRQSLTSEVVHRLRICHSSRCHRRYRWLPHRISC
jgi:cellulose synthase/poly-beta-1,6-N-acetylglucosamine synthase-like glycosyltransferase